MKAMLINNFNIYYYITTIQEIQTMTINNPIDLYTIKGSTIAGKLMLFNLLEQKDNLTKDEIRMKLVDEYDLMKPKSFKSLWRDYTNLKRYCSFLDE